MDQANVNFEVYEDGSIFYGFASLVMPTLQNLSTTISGAGISGNIEAVMLGLVDAMNVTINFRTTTPDSIKLSELRRHHLDFRIAQNHESSIDDSIDIVPEKHVMVVVPKSHNVGNIAPNSTTNGSGEYALRYWATWINDKKVREISPEDYIYEVNGVDYLAPVRKALGK